MVDCLTLLLEDIARLEPVVGKNQYLPLTRRIHRGLVFRKIGGANDEQTLEEIVRLWEYSVAQLRSDSLGKHSNRLDIFALAQDVETFLADGSLSIPVALQTWLDSMGPVEASVSEHLQAFGWRCFDLLSILPSDARTDLIHGKTIKVLPSHFSAIEAEHQESRQRLVEGSMRFVLRICSRFTGQGVPYLDLVQEGFKGLLRAIEMFDERAGSRFETYSATWIRQFVSRYIADSASLIRVPVHAVEQVKTILPVYEELTNLLGRQPSDDEYAVASGALTSDEIDALRYEVKRRSAVQKVNYLGKYVAMLDKPDEDIEEEDKDYVSKLRFANSQFKEQHGWYPTKLELLYAVGWITQAQVNYVCSEIDAESSKEIDRILVEYRKIKKYLARLRIACARHFPVDSAVMDSERDEACWPFSELLSTDDITENNAIRSASAELVEDMLTSLAPREVLVLNARLGLDNGAPETLDIIGQRHGLTRERIRQIEAKAIRKLRHPLRSRKLRELIDEDAATLETTWNRRRSSIIREMESRAISNDAAILVAWADEQQHIRESLQRFIGSGRRRLWNTRGRAGRAELFRQILREYSAPMHYQAIHELAIRKVPNQLQIAPQQSYATLFYHQYFQTLGKGYFGLIEWDTSSDTAIAASRLRNCPKPFLQAGTAERSFFESVMFGRDMLAQRASITARQFFLEMAAWARRDGENVQEAQNAFDAWYAVGLVNRTDYLRCQNLTIQLAAPRSASVNDMRAYCLNNLCERVPKIAELLLTLERIPRPTTERIEKTLFGVSQVGTEVNDRLQMLKAFGAVRMVDDEWQLTAAGKATLDASQPDDLPDFAEMTNYEEPDEEPIELDIDDDFALLSL